MAAPDRSEAVGLMDEPRIDSHDKLTGSAVYAEDMPEPSNLHFGAPVASPFAHARIRSIDASRALRLPGVIAVLDREHFAEHGVDVQKLGGLDPSCIVADKARFEGDLLGLVVATDARTARRGAELVEVDYEQLPPVLSPEDAFADGAPLLHEALGTNMVFDDSFEWGDAETGLRDSHRVFERTFVSPTIFHHPMEPVGTGIVDFSGDVAQIWAPTNTPMRDAAEVAGFFALKPEGVRLRVPYVGGGFGAKKTTRAMMAALAVSRTIGKPIKVIATAGESFRVAVRHAMVYKGRMGVAADGSIAALDVDLLVNAGAYFTGGRVATHNACIGSWGCYRIPNFRVRAWTALTNRVPATPHRGTGKTQTTYAIECFVDDVARQLGVDALEFRRRNVLLPGERVAETWRVRGEEVPSRTPPLDVDFPALTQKAIDVLDPLPRESATPAPRPAKLRGRGVAVSLRHASKGDVDSTAKATLQPDGRVRIAHNAADLGQGIYNMINIVAARSMGLPRSQIVVETPDTSNQLPFPGATAQRTTVQMGNAVRAACEGLTQQILELASEAEGGSPSDWRIVEGQLHRGDRTLPLASVLRDAPGLTLEAVGTDSDPSATDKAFGAFDHWAPGIAVADVEVDPETGEIRLLQCSLLADAGEVIHYRSARGQVEGGAIMGVGIALCEEFLYEDGQLLNADAFQYRLPLMRDLPQAFRTTLLESGDGPGPFGSKGVSQVSIPCITPAIGNAILNAIGAPVLETPFTPERILQALGRIPASEA